MTARLTSQLLVGALVRRAQAAGGGAMILHKGEPVSGAIVVQLLDRGVNLGLFERIADLSGGLGLVPCGPPPTSPASEVSQYIARRTMVDPDIWFVELDTVLGQQLAAEILCAG
ncbi:MAG TPA: DUF1491 family protein [Sphingobium sp.]|nr:DUF1491 family protein [Sphingobium sp.]